MKDLHTMVRATNLDDSLDFYCNKLGLVEIARADEVGPSGEVHRTLRVHAPTVGGAGAAGLALDRRVSGHAQLVAGHGDLAAGLRERVTARAQIRHWPKSTFTTSVVTAPPPTGTFLTSPASEVVK